MDFTYLKQFMDKLALEKSPGNAIEIFKDGKRVFKYAAGLSDVENNVSMTGEEYFNIYSCSKITTVTAAMQLIERGIIIPSDPLSDYIPEYKEMYVKDENGNVDKAKNVITVADLFRMTAGFTYDLSSGGIKKARELTGGKMDTATVARCIASDVLSFEPGTKWQYSLCHDVLAGLVSIVSGMPFREYVKKNIFEPLGMKDTVYHTTPEIEAKTAEQYTFVPNGSDENFDVVEAQMFGNATDGRLKNIGKKVNGFILGPEYDSGGAGITTTVSDYNKLLTALANFGLGLSGERILARGSVELLRTNTLSDKLLPYFSWRQLKGYGYGYGVRTLIDKAAAGSVGNIGEFGWGGAAGATALVDPKIDMAFFFVQHTCNPREEYYQPRLRNVVYNCIER